MCLPIWISKFFDCTVIKSKISIRILAVSIDDKRALVDLFLTKATRQIDYRQKIVEFCNKNSDKTDPEITFTDKGLLYKSDYHSLTHAAMISFVCVKSSRMLQDITFETQKRWIKLGLDQVGYILKNNYLIGYGNKDISVQPNHRASACPAALGSACGNPWRDSSKPNPNKLFGAIVGGPDAFDQFVDDRKNVNTNGVGLDSNAAVSGLIASLYFE